jgi:ABC-type branched-subunit amino acid transport system substrate-binding protein
LASLAPSVLSACASVADATTQAANTPRIAVILPMTGPSADLGRSMERAVALTRPADERETGFLILDSGGTAEGAGAAAGQAASAGAGLILGPLFAREVPGVLAAAGGIPVVTFSNDADLVGSGAFVLGITASQGTSAILAYARSRGVRRVAAVTATDPWSRQTITAARVSAASVGLELFEVSAADAAASDDVGALLTAASAGTLPDAVLFSQSGDEIAPLAARVAGLGLQILGPSRWAEESATLLGAAEGAWIAAPDPAAFRGFAQAFETAHQTAPGLLAGLAFDAARIGRRLLAADRLSRDGLVTSEGFQGALGAVRFAGDGRCTRELAIQVVDRGTLRVVGHLAGA